MSILSLVLFVAGAGVALVGSIKIGDFEAEGQKVRVAGFMLMMPLIAIQILLFMAGSLTGANPDVVGFISFLELPALGVAGALAYWLVVQEQSEGGISFVPRQSQQDNKPPRRVNDGPKRERPSHPLWQNRDEDADDTSQGTDPQQDEQAVKTERPESKPPEPKPRPAPRPPSSRKRGNFPTVMTTTEAALYLNMTEDAVLELIESGKLTAARINYRYRISRSVLDEFIKEHQGDE